MSDAPLPSSFDGDVDFYNENRWRKFTRRLKEEPLIPLGVGLTCWALFAAARSIRTGDGAKTNRMFRYRLYAQSFTLVAMLGSSFYYQADRLKRKEFTKLVNEKKAQEKRDAWIRELEARDEEDKEWRTKIGKVRDLQKEEKERQMIAEKRRREAKTDDGRGAIATIKEKAREARETEARREEVEKKPIGPMPTSRPTEEKAEKESVSVLGEQGGGLFGINHLKNLWKESRAETQEDSGKDEEQPEK